MTAADPWDDHRCSVAEGCFADMAEWRWARAQVKAIRQAVADLGPIAVNYRSGMYHLAGCRLVGLWLVRITVEDVVHGGRGVWDVERTWGSATEPPTHPYFQPCAGCRPPARGVGS